MSQSSKFVKVVWKIQKPRNQAAVSALLAAHWSTATRGSNEPVTSLLIRSSLHDTTTNSKGQRVKDDWHVTSSWKNPFLLVRNLFSTGHGYTAGKGDYNVTRVTLGNDKLINTTDRAGKHVWPPEPLDIKKYLQEEIHVDDLNELIEKK